MNQSFRRLVVVCLAASLALPAAFAAKGERKKKKAESEAPAVSFSTADKNSDGSVTQSEYIAAFKSSMSEEAAKVRFEALDKNFDGKLSKEEFNTAPAPEKKQRKKKNV